MSIVADTGSLGAQGNSRLASDARRAPVVAALASAPAVVKVSLIIMAAMIAIAVLAPVIAPYSPTHQSLLDRLARPSGTHLLGNDQLGRDVFSRTLYGSRVSLTIAVFGSIVGLIVGSLLGLAAGYIGGAFGHLVMFLADAQQATPFIIVSLIVIAVAHASMVTLLILVSIYGWEVYARIARASTLVVRESQYVLASRCIGVSEGRILFRHVLPNIASPLIVVATLQATAIILLESSLSFLGIGVQPPTPSWGEMIAEGRQYLNIAWWTVVGPAAGILLLTLAVSLVGDWLRDLLDPATGRR